MSMSHPELWKNTLPSIIHEIWNGCNYNGAHPCMTWTILIFSWMVMGFLILTLLVFFIKGIHVISSVLVSDQPCWYNYSPGIYRSKMSLWGKAISVLRLFETSMPPFWLVLQGILGRVSNIITMTSKLLKVSMSNFKGYHKETITFPRMTATGVALLCFVTDVRLGKWNLDSWIFPWESIIHKQP